MFPNLRNAILIFLDVNIRFVFWYDTLFVVYLTTLLETRSIGNVQTLCYIDINVKFLKIIQISWELRTEI
jgi:hypothetical protein